VFKGCTRAEPMPNLPNLLLPISKLMHLLSLSSTPVATLSPTLLSTSNSLLISTPIFAPHLSLSLFNSNLPPTIALILLNELSAPPKITWLLLSHLFTPNSPLISGTSSFLM
jgi:hypothetical protein